MSNPIRLASAARFTEHPPLPHQLAAWNWLQEQQKPETMAQFAELFRADPPVKPPLVQDASMLLVPYFSQNDNASGTGYRECFSSSCAMLAAFHVGGVKSDDEYNRIRAKHGDSTDAAAQIATLEELGLKAKFITNGVASMLEGEINRRRPVAVGWLHHGTPQAPAGGGHWTVVIGYTPKEFIMNDPNGEADLVNGGYVNHSGGRGVSYSRLNWLPRWSPTPASGWMVTAEPA